MPDVAAAPAAARRAEDQAGRPEPARRHGADDTVAGGQVPEENPGGGASVGKGSTVTLTVSTGKPKVRGAGRARPERHRRGDGARAAGLNPKVVRIYSPAAAGHGDRRSSRSRATRSSRARPCASTSRAARSRCRCPTSRPAVPEREVGARGPGLRRLARRHPVRQGAGRRRGGGPAGGHAGSTGLDDHALGLEGAGDDAGARRDEPESGDGRADPHRRGPDAVR